MTRHPSHARAQEILRIARVERLRDVIAYWLSVHPGDRLPGRQHFDPLDVPSALRDLVLTDVERDPYRFRIRLMGTAVVRAMGADFTGSYLDEALPDFTSSYGIRHRIEVAETGLPNYRYGVSNYPFRLDFAPLERVYLPLAADGERVDMILAMLVYMVADDGGASPAEVE